jgi:hypothetical protein
MIRDALGNKSSFAAQAPVDLAAPVPYAVVDTAGANNGRFESADTLTVSFTEPVTNSATTSSVVLTHAATDTVAIPGLLNGTASTGRPGYITSGTATFTASALSKPATNQVRVTLAAGASCSSPGCTNLGTEGTAGNLVVNPSTTIADTAATPNTARQNTATPSFSIRLF